MSEDFDLVFSFEIDNGELDGIPANQIFVLGYELGQLWEQAKNGEEINRTVRIENKGRIERMFEHLKRPFKLTFMPADSSESWLWLSSHAP